MSRSEVLMNGTPVAVPPPGKGLRLLHVCAGNLYGGVEAMLLSLAEYGPAQGGLSQDFAICFRGRFSEALEKLGVRAFDLGAVRVSRPWTALRARRELAHLLKAGQYDYVVCHSAWTMSVFGTVLRSQAATKLVYWVHDIPRGTHWLERIARHHRPDIAICNSQYTAKHLSKLYPHVPDPVIYCPVPRPITTTTRAAVRASLGTAEDVPVIAMVARLEERKGHRYLLGALQELRHRRWECWIAGGPHRAGEAEYLDRIKRIAVECGVADRVRFLGERRDVGDLLSAADILAHPHITPEPFGIALVEGLALGLPVVGSDLGGPTEILAGGAGVLVPPQQPKALAAALDRLLQDREYREQFGEPARRRAQEMCAPQETARQLYDVLLHPPPVRHVAVGEDRVAASLPFWPCVRADLLAHIPLEDRGMSPAARARTDLRNGLLSSGFHVSLLYRLSHAARHQGGIAGRLLAMFLFWLLKHFYGCTISPRARLGGGLILPHPQGMVIGADVVVGERAWIYHNVTLGGGRQPGMPQIGDDARIYAGAVLVGGIQIGHRVMIGANSVITGDIPDDSRVRPAHVVVKTGGAAL